MRSLGEFVGIIARAARTDPSKDRRELRRDVEVERRDTTAGKATLRRTVIEEIEIERPRRNN
jgi:hypothetical protein